MGRCGTEPRALRPVAGLCVCRPCPLLTLEPGSRPALHRQVGFVGGARPDALQPLSAASVTLCFDPGEPEVWRQGRCWSAAWARWPGGNQPHRRLSRDAAGVNRASTPAGLPSRGLCCLCARVGGRGRVAGMWPRAVSPCAEAQLSALAPASPQLRLSGVCHGREGRSRDSCLWLCRLKIRESVYGLGSPPWKNP